MNPPITVDDVDPTGIICLRLQDAYGQRHAVPLTIAEAMTLAEQILQAVAA